MSDKQTVAEFSNQRLFDLVRQQRAELHDAELINDAEYAALAMATGSVQRLETYDDLQSQLAALKLANEKLVELVKGANGFMQHHHACAKMTAETTDECTCGLTTLRAEIERAKGGR